MFNALFLVSATLAAQAECPLSEKASAGWAASAALEELAQKRGVLESKVGAVLILRRDEACEILEQQRNLLAETKQAIENECQQFIFLAPGSEQQYMSAAKGSEYVPTSLITRTTVPMRKRGTSRARL